MRRDVILALSVSLLIHGGAAWFGYPIPHAPVRVVRIDEIPICRLPMPPIEPDPVEKTDLPDDPKPLPDIAPPTLPDVPLLTRDEPFVQPFEPPRPDNARIDPKMVNIPVGSIGGGGGDPNSFELKMLDDPPRATYQAKPVYPFELRSRGITGQVMVGFIVGVTGDVHDAYAISSTDHGFESSAVQAVMHWKFKPGKKAGRPVNTRMQVSIVFSISGD